LIVALVPVLMLTSPAQGSVVEAFELSELVAEADRIVLGRVVFSESFWRANGTIATWHRVEVKRHMRGSGYHDDEILIETMGGRVGDIVMRVEGEPSLAVGERVIVFARDDAYGVFRPVGMAQGVMRLRMDEGAETVFQSREGLLLVRRNAKGELTRSRGALPNGERLETFLTRLQSMIVEQAGESNE